MRSLDVPTGMKNFKVKLRDSTVCVTYRRDSNTYEFGCDCGNSATCEHILQMQGQRKDAEFFQDPDLWENEMPLFVGVPILSAPIVLYWVQLEQLEDEPGFTLVKHPHHVWLEHAVDTSITMSIAKIISNGALKGVLCTDELCMITEGEGTGDITSSIFDAFSAFHIQHKPVYQCRQRWHKGAQERGMQHRLNSEETRGTELARLFFTDSCTPCAQPAVDIDFDDLVPGKFTPPKKLPFAAIPDNSINLSKDDGTGGWYLRR